MSNKFCSVKSGRILEMALEAYAIAEYSYDNDLLPREEEIKFEKIWEYVQYGEQNDLGN